MLFNSKCDAYQEKGRVNLGFDKHFTDPILRQIERSNIKVGFAYLLHRIDLLNQYIQPKGLKATLISQTLCNFWPF